MIKGILRRRNTVNEPIHVALSYQEDLPEWMANEFIGETSLSGLHIGSEKRPIGLYAAFEWAIPTLIAVYILRPYLDASLSEAGKDHYSVLKRALVKLLEKVYGSTLEQRPLRRSLLFSVQSATRDGEPIKFVFPEGVDHETYSTMLDGIFGMLTEHHSMEEGDRLSDQISNSTMLGRTYYFEFSEGQKSWIVIDVNSEIEKRKLAEHPSKDDN